MKALLIAVFAVLFANTLVYGQGGKQVSRIEQVDFANFTFPAVEGCGKKPTSLKMGKYEDKDIHVQLPPVLYADMTGEKINQAIVPLYCDTHGNFSITEIFLYTLRNGEPVLLAKLPESSVGRDYKKYYPDGGTWAGISRVVYPFPIGLQN